MKKLSLLDITDVLFTCQDCQTEAVFSVPVFSDIDGEFVEFACLDCNHDYIIRLDDN